MNPSLALIVKTATQNVFYPIFMPTMLLGQSPLPQRIAVAAQVMHVQHAEYEDKDDRFS
jgi:hypothetical protein